ncbi:hypothetical protein SAMN04487995_3219 [Dyadobacter koreensis]|uniref:Uncharacterized protein n=1 Tax=Dyadobacter koreensis TaxID=408657 RepID=A0A1H6WCZ9_9BACT|nr:hypothetical protein [Dyadobacter koreensis]SEJ10195.1 hypothetical protein SAMN04487995_3219 [Dyadobacter koreensis]
MKTIKLLIVLVLFSLQASATGYSHNMFVAHKKLQAGKEIHAVKEYGSKRVPAKSVIHKTAVVHQSGLSAISYTKDLATKMSRMVTLNERIIEEVPTSFFEKEEACEINSSIATKLAGFIKDVLYTFLGASSLTGS